MLPLFNEVIIIGKVLVDNMMFMYALHHNNNSGEPQTERKARMYLLPIVLGGVAVFLNIFVAYRILTRNRRVVQRQKLFFLSLAIADGLFGLHFCSHLLSEIEEHMKIIEVFERTTFGLSFISGVLHIMALTTDRFLATRYPLKHKVKMTRQKIIMIIITIWVVSALLTTMQFMVAAEILEWSLLTPVLVASFMCVITYTHIARLAIKRKRNLKFQCRGNSRSPSLKTTFLSFSITVVFVICNAPFPIVKITMQYDGESIAGCIVHSLMVLNAITDPIVYTIVDLVYQKYTRYTQRKVERKSNIIVDAKLNKSM